MSFLILLYLPKFIGVLLIILIVYYGIRYITRYVLPLLIDKSVKNMQQKMEDQYRQQNQGPSRPKDEVIIERNQTNPRNNNPDKGEYVDFEEVD